MGDVLKMFKSKVYNYICFTIIVLFVLAAIINKNFEDFSFSFFIPLIFIGLAFQFYRNYSNINENKFIIRLIIVTFLIKLIAVYCITELLIHYNGIPFLSYKDDYNYYNSAVDIARYWRVNGISIVENVQFSTGFYSGYPNICALGIYYFGENEYVLRIMNSIVSCFILYFMYKTMRMLFEERASKISISIIGFSPLLIYFSSFILKDVFLLLFTIVVLYCFIKILKHKFSAWLFFLILANLTLMIFFRAATIVPLFLAFTVVYVVSFFKFRKGFSYSSIAIVGFVGFALFELWDYIATFNFVSDSGAYYSPRIESLSNSSISSSGTNVGKLGFLAILGIPLFIITSLFLPTPLFVNLGDAETINYSVSAMLYHLVLVPFLLLGLFYCFKNIKRIEPGLLLIVLILVFFKVGLAMSINSLFSARQSLGAIYIMYLLLPICFQYKLKLNRSKQYFLITFIVMIIYNLLRLVIRL